MMKKWLYLLAAVLCFSSVEAQAQFKDNQIQDNKIYLFYSEGCPHCKDAEAYLQKNYSNLAMERLNVRTKHGYNLFVKCVNKFDLGNEVGTPLFCMGKNYLMGWDTSYQAKFDEYVKPFIK